MKWGPFEIICAIILIAIFGVPILMFLYVTFCIFTDNFNALLYF